VLELLSTSVDWRRIVSLDFIAELEDTSRCFAAKSSLWSWLIVGERIEWGLYK
jgi:hypothetical protein